MNEYFLFGAAMALMVYGAHWYANKRAARFSNAIKAKAEIYEHMDALLQETPVQRFLIFSTSNGGGQPRVGTPLYANAIFEKCVYPFEKRFTAFQRVPLDAHYIEQLIACRSMDFIILDPKKTPVDSLINGVYKDEGVSMALWFFIHENATQFFYASIAVDHTYHDELLRDEHLWKYRRTCAQIRKIFQKYSI